MESPGFESMSNKTLLFSISVLTSPVVHQDLSTIDNVALSLGVKRPGLGVDHPSLSSAGRLRMSRA